MPSPRRFPPPWSIDELEACFVVSCPDFSLGCGPIALFRGQTILDHRPRPGEPAGAIMWNEREMPARWYKLLRERMQVEQLRMRIVKQGYLIKDYELQDVLTEAHKLDAEMLLVMRQTIAEALAREEVLSPQAT